ncbi:MAG: hypothetical protein PHQ47_03085, partial [Candidatus Portnoybacteria bacterium]|nr:hypothetical protein [Candidatus Portnoybacteria bacterium]
SFAEDLIISLNSRKECLTCFHFDNFFLTLANLPAKIPSEIKDGIKDLKQKLDEVAAAAISVWPMEVRLNGKQRELSVEEKRDLIITEIEKEKGGLIFGRQAKRWRALL